MASILILFPKDGLQPIMIFEVTQVDGSFDLDEALVDITLGVSNHVLLP